MLSHAYRIIVMLCYAILSYLMLPYPIVSYFILSFPNNNFPILSYLLSLHCLRSTLRLFHCFVYIVSLILSATAGHASTVQMLLDNGAEIEAQSDRTKDTALSLACSGGRQEVGSLVDDTGGEFIFPIML